MGSFYSTCSVSHMTLTNQKTSIQLLVPNNKSLKEHKSRFNNMRYKINLTDNQAKEVESLVNKFTNRSIYDEYKYISIELTKTFISKRLNTVDKEMSRVLVDCFIVESDRGQRYVYKEDILYSELLKFMTPYIREYKIDKVL